MESRLEMFDKVNIHGGVGGERGGEDDVLVRVDGIVVGVSSMRRVFCLEAKKLVVYDATRDSKRYGTSSYGTKWSLCYGGSSTQVYWSQDTLSNLAQRLGHAWASHRRGNSQIFWMLVFCMEY